ncbi:MAG: hypothetical protein OXK16_13890 [bacterium]|nr:hypothetical protein [bacterium]
MIVDEASGSSLRIQTSKIGLDDERLKRLSSELGVREGSDEVALLSYLLDALGPGDARLLDAAASFAACHNALWGQEDRLRGFLGLLTLRCESARELGAEPRLVFDSLERLVTESTRLEGEAVRTIWREPMLKPAAAAVALGAKPANREKVRRLRLRSALLGLPHSNGFLYPAFQFDTRRRDIFPEVRAVNQRLGSDRDPWGVASWWVSHHSRLRARPVDLVGTGRAGDLAAAAAAMVEALG